MMDPSENAVKLSSVTLAVPSKENTNYDNFPNLHFLFRQLLGSPWFN